MRDRRTPTRTLLHVKDFLQRVNVGIDEQASIDFDCGVGPEVENLALVLLGQSQLVRDAIL